MKSSGTKTHHLRLLGHPRDQFSHHTLEEDITWYPPDEQMINCILFNNHRRNHIDCATFGEMCRLWYQWEGLQGSKLYGVMVARCNMQKILTCDSCEERFSDSILNRGYHAQIVSSKEMQNIGDDASTSSLFLCSMDGIHRFTCCGLHDS